MSIKLYTVYKNFPGPFCGKLVFVYLMIMDVLLKEAPECDRNTGILEVLSLLLNCFCDLGQVS